MSLRRRLSGSCHQLELNRIFMFMLDPSDISFDVRVVDFLRALVPGIVAVIVAGVIDLAFVVITRVRGALGGSRRHKWLSKLTTQPGKSHVIWTIMLLAVIYAAFQAFDTVNVKNYSLKRQVADLSIPEIQFRLGRMDIASQPDGLQIEAFTTVQDIGAPSAILADSWTFDLTIPDGRTIHGVPYTIGNDPVRVCFAGGQSQMVFEKGDDLSLRASQTIDRGGYRDGELVFFLPSATKADLVDSAEISISALDVYGKRHSMSVSLGELKAHSQAVFMPSLSHPRPEPGCPTAH